MPGLLRTAVGTFLHRLWRMTKGWSPYGRLVYEEGGSGSISMRSDGSIVVNPPSAELFGIYPQNIWMAAAIGAKQRAVASAPWGVWKDVEGGDPERVHGHPAEKLLYDPDNNEVWEQQAQRLSVHLDVAGEAFLEISRAEEGGEPKRLSVLFPPHVKILRHPQEGIVGYEFSRSSFETVHLEPVNVVYMRHPHPALDYKGMGPAEAAAPSGIADTLGRRWNLGFFKRGAQPDTVLSTDQEIPKAERTALLDEWMAKHGGGKGRGVAMLPYGLKAAAFGIAHREMQFRDLLRASRDEILAALQVPPIMCGVREGANFATVDAELADFRDRTLYGILRAIFGPLTTQVLWAFEGAQEEGLYFAPDVEAMMTPTERVQRDTAARGDFRDGISTRTEARKRLGYAEEVAATAEPKKKDFFAYELEGGVFTLDEVREAKGLGPHPNSEFGKLTLPELRIKLGITAAGNEIGSGSVVPGAGGPDFAKSLPPGGGNGNGHARRLLTAGGRERVMKTILREVADDDGSGDDDEDAARSSRSRRLYIPYRMDKARKKAEDPIAARLEALFAKYLARQREAVLGLIRARLAKADAAPKVTLSGKAILDAISEPVGKAMQSQFKAAVNRGGELQAEAAGISWREADPAVNDYLATRITNLERVLGETTSDRVKGALDAGWAAGDTEEDLLRRVEGTDEEGLFSRARARRIARTETHAAVMTGAHAGMKQAGVTKKQWLAAVDDRTREAHLEASGQVVGVDEPFIVGGEELMFPGDPSGSPGNVIQCFLPGTIIEGKVVSGVRSKYAGKAVEIVTRGGRKLCVTPNHPIPTHRIDPRSNVGAIHEVALPACELKHGDMIAVSTRGGESGCFGGGMLEPASAESVFDLIAQRGSVDRRIAADDDFHGDGRAVDARDMANALAVISPRDSRPICIGVASALSFDLFTDEDYSTGSGGDRFADAMRRIFWRNEYTNYLRVDTVESVRVFEYAGFVYDFESPHGWVMADGIVASNCRCTTLSLFDDDADTSAEDIADALDMMGDEDAQGQVEDAVEEEVNPDVIARVKLDDIERLKVVAGEGDEVGYDWNRKRVTVGPDAEAEDIADAVREHLVNSLVDKADARGFMNVIRLGDLPEPEGVKAKDEVSTARRIIASVVNGDWAGLAEFVGEEISPRQKKEFETAAANFWIGPASGGPVPVRRERAK